jgi:signal transduction histidine kinase
MTSLSNRNLKQFLACATLILLCCAPLFFFAMKHFYTEDLDELIIYRSDEFMARTLPRLSLSEVDEWNRYSEDMQILPFSDAHRPDRTTEAFLYSKSEGHGVNYRLVYRMISIEGEPRILLSRTPMIENRDLFRSLLTQYGLIFIILLAALGLVQRLMSRKLWKPFYDSLKKMESYTLEQDSVPKFESTDIREFSRLNGMLSTLTGNNLRIYRQQKEFIENASHELQTPLAVFQSQLDMLLQEPDLTEKQAGIIQSLYAVSARMTRLNRNLLLLAKIDNAQFRDVTEVNLAELLEASMPYFKDLAESSAVEISIGIHAPLILAANASLIEIMINNLVMNAIRHNVAGGKIAVRVKDSQLEIINTGRKQPLETAGMFRRFNHIPEEAKGTGLGLSIVYQICKLYGWKVMYAYRDEKHGFTVRFG